MFINFEKMNIRDFRSYVGSHTFDFGETGLHLLKGKNKHKPSLGANDAGKSTLWDAFCWCVTGYMVKKLRNTKTVPWQKAKATPTVKIWFLIDKKRHSLERSAYPTGLRLDARDASQAEIDALLQLPFEILTQSLLMGQGRPLFFDLEPRRKMELFSEILPLQRWDDRSERAGKKFETLKSQESELDTRIALQVSVLKTISGDLSDLKSKSATWEKDNERTIQQVAKDMKPVADDLKRVTAIRDKADLDYESANLKLKDFDVDMEKIEKAIDELGKKRDIALLKVRDEKNAIRYHTDALGGLEDADRCPTCNQEITGSDIAKHRAEQIRLRKACKTQLVKSEDAYARIEEELHEVCDGRVKLRDLRKKLQAKANDLESLLRTSTTDFANYNAKLVNLKTKLVDLEKGTNPYDDQVAKLRKRKAQLTGKLEDDEADLSKVRKLMEPTKFWIKGFKDLRLQIVDEVLGELEMATNAMLPEIGLEDWAVEYDIERETKAGTLKSGLHVQIFSPDHDEPVEWEEWGGGVGQRLRLISALALSEVLLNHAGVTTNLEILDEPTRSLNAEGVTDLCEFLANRAESLKKSIWLVDHRSIESTAFSSVRTIVKDASGSRVI